MLDSRAWGDQSASNGRCAVGIGSEDSFGAKVAKAKNGREVLGFSLRLKEPVQRRLDESTHFCGPFGRVNHECLQQESNRDAAKVLGFVTDEYLGNTLMTKTGGARGKCGCVAGTRQEGGQSLPRRPRHRYEVADLLWSGDRPRRARSRNARLE